MVIDLAIRLLISAKLILLVSILIQKTLLWRLWGGGGTQISPFVSEGSPRFFQSLRGHPDFAKYYLKKIK